MSHPRIAPCLALLVCTGAAVAATAAHPATGHAQTGTPLLWTTTEFVLFDFVPVGGSAERPITIVNGGDGAMVIRNLDMVGPTPGDFKVAGDTCRAQPIAPGGGKCNITVAFRPTAIGTRAAQLRITQDSGCLNWIGLAGSATGAGAASTRAAASPAPGSVTARAASQCPLSLPPVNVTQTITKSDSQALTLPAARTCKSRRVVHVRIPKPKSGIHYKQVTALLNGKRIKIVKGKRISTKVDLRGLPRGRFTLRLTMVPSKGKTIHWTRHYVTCVKV
jgi:hypothetical protein